MNQLIVALTNNNKVAFIQQKHDQAKSENIDLTFTH